MMMRWDEFKYNRDCYYEFRMMMCTNTTCNNEEEEKHRNINKTLEEVEVTINYNGSVWDVLGL